MSERKDLYADQSHIPLRFWGYSLTESPARFANPDLVQQLTNPDIDADEASFYLWGDVGRGKTGLAVAYAMTRLAWDNPDVMPSSVSYWPVSRLLREIRSSFGGDAQLEASIFKECRAASLLILDDIGVEKPTEWMQSTLYEIVSVRHEERCATLFTSNLSIAELNARIGERTTWRIIEMCGAENIVHVAGPNLRDRA
ncbi:MAG: ATP-binding protein [Dehalococcoidia bacterium]|nr:ATP-binding protein [Dehalococcoidia bacterium]